MPLSFLTKSFVSKNTTKADNGIKSSRRKRRLISSSQSNITPCDIQSWLSNIEPTIPNQGYFQDTDDKSYPFSRVKFKQSLAQMTLDQLRHHDEAQKEAEDLLNDWVQKSLYDSNLADKDSLYVVDNKELEEIPCNNYLDIYETDSPLDFNEDEALETVMQNMLKKELVPKRIFSNLGLDNSKQQHDPSLKMELRRQQVKKNRLKRENDMNRRRQEKQMKKEAHLKAYQRIMKEERLKALKHQQEEREIQKQMAAIRRQMLAEKKEQKEKKQEQIQITNGRPQQSTTEVTPHKIFSSVEKCTKMAKTEQQMAKYEALEVKQKAINIQILQRHFMAWTTVILQKRVRYGKVSALADWKLLLRHWNAWKSLSMQNKMEKELQVHQQNIRECQRKDKMAGEHYITQLMKKYFWTWQLYLHREKECQLLKLSQKETKDKMEKLLIAAASGKINVANSLSNSETKSKKLTKKKPDIEKCIKQVKISSVPCNSDGNIIECSQLSSVPWKASRKLLDMETPQFSQLVAGTNTETYSSDQKQLSAFLITAGYCTTTTAAATTTTTGYFETATSAAGYFKTSTTAAAVTTTTAAPVATTTAAITIADTTVTAADATTFAPATTDTEAPEINATQPPLHHQLSTDTVTTPSNPNTFGSSTTSTFFLQTRTTSLSSFAFHNYACARCCRLCLWTFLMSLLLLALLIVIAVIVIAIVL